MVPSADRLLTFALACFVLIVIPGPSVLFTIGRALTVGRTGALLSVAGNAIGCYLQVVAVAVGIGALVQRSAEAYSAVKLIGAAYLIYLGVQAIRHRHDLAAAVGAPPALGRPRRLLLDGLLVGAANPKTIIFFTAVMPQFADRGSGNLAGQLLLLGAVFPIIALVSDSVWALVAGAARGWLARSPRRLAVVGGSGGAAIVGLGVYVAVTGRRD